MNHPPIDSDNATSTAPTTTAWIYLRVSTKRQASKGGLSEGFSLPAQRDDCVRIAGEVFATVTREYVEKGESATTDSRDELQRLLRDLDRSPPPTYVIFHAVDRWSRDAIDYYKLKGILRERGVKLINASAPFGDDDSAEIIEAVHVALAQVEIKKLRRRVKMGMRKAAENGVTNGKAAVGYLNKRDYVDGEERKYVDLDEDRASLVLWSYRMYATGEWTIRQLTDALQRLGLTTAPSGQRPSRPLSPSMVARMLQNRYYLGEVKHGGIWYPGRHQALVPKDLFEKVGEILATKAQAREKHRKHSHYLKGTIFCARCQSRYCVQIAKGRGGTYEYFFCLGRNKYRNLCPQGHLHISAVEEAIEHHYDSVSLHAHEVAELRELVEQALAETEADLKADHERLAKHRDKLLNERKKLLQLHYDDKLPADLFGMEMERIEHEVTLIDHEAQQLAEPFEGTVQDLIDLETLIHDLGQLYRASEAQGRRQINQALYEKLLEPPWV